VDPARALRRAGPTGAGPGAKGDRALRGRAVARRPAPRRRRHDPRRGRAEMSKRRRISVGLMLSFSAVLLFSAALFYLSRRPIAIGAGKVGPKPTHTTGVAQKEEHGQDRFVGVVVSRAALDLTPRIEGRLKELTVTVGQEVKANDKIAVIDDDAVK